MDPENSGTTPKYEPISGAGYLSPLGLSAYSAHHNPAPTSEEAPPLDLTHPAADTTHPQTTEVADEQVASIEQVAEVDIVGLDLSQPAAATTPDVTATELPTESFIHPVEAQPLSLSSLSGSEPADSTPIPTRRTLSRQLSLPAVSELSTNLGAVDNNENGPSPTQRGRTHQRPSSASSPSTSPADTPLPLSRPSSSSSNPILSTSSPKLTGAASVAHHHRNASSPLMGGFSSPKLRPKSPGMKPFGGAPMSPMSPSLRPAFNRPQSLIWEDKPFSPLGHAENEIDKKNRATSEADDLAYLLQSSDGLFSNAHVKRQTANVSDLKMIDVVRRRVSVADQADRMLALRKSLIGPVMAATKQDEENRQLEIAAVQAAIQKEKELQELNAPAAAATPATDEIPADDTAETDNVDDGENIKIISDDEGDEEAKKSGDEDTSTEDSSDDETEKARKIHKRFRYREKKAERDARLKELFEKVESKKAAMREKRQSLASVGGGGAGSSDSDSEDGAADSKKADATKSAITPDGSVPQSGSNSRSESRRASRVDAWLVATELRRRLTGGGGNEEDDPAEIEASIREAKRIAREEQEKDEADAAAATKAAYEAALALHLGEEEEEIEEVVQEEILSTNAAGETVVEKVSRTRKVKRKKRASGSASHRASTTNNLSLPSGSTTSSRRGSFRLNGSRRASLQLDELTALRVKMSAIPAAAAAANNTTSSGDQPSARRRLSTERRLSSEKRLSNEGGKLSARRRASGGGLTQPVVVVEPAASSSHASGMPAHKIKRHTGGRDLIAAARLNINDKPSEAVDRIGAAANVDSTTTSTTPRKTVSPGRKTNDDGSENSSASFDRIRNRRQTGPLHPELAAQLAAQDKIEAVDKRLSTRLPTAGVSVAIQRKKSSPIIGPQDPLSPMVTLGSPTQATHVLRSPGKSILRASSLGNLNSSPALDPRILSSTTPMSPPSSLRPHLHPVSFQSDSDGELDEEGLPKVAVHVFDESDRKEPSYESTTAIPTHQRQSSELLEEGEDEAEDEEGGAHVRFAGGDGVLVEDEEEELLASGEDDDEYERYQAEEEAFALANASNADLEDSSPAFGSPKSPSSTNKQALMQELGLEALVYSSEETTARSNPSQPSSASRLNAAAGVESGSNTVVFGSEASINDFVQEAIATSPSVRPTSASRQEIVVPLVASQTIAIRPAPKPARIKKSPPRRKPNEGEPFSPIRGVAGGGLWPTANDNITSNPATRTPGSPSRASSLRAARIAAKYLQADDKDEEEKQQQQQHIMGSSSSFDEIPLDSSRDSEASEAYYLASDRIEAIGRTPPAMKYFKKRQAAANMSNRPRSGSAQRKRSITPPGDKRGFGSSARQRPRDLKSKEAYENDPLSVRSNMSPAGRSARARAQQIFGRPSARRNSARSAGSSPDRSVSHSRSPSATTDRRRTSASPRKEQQQLPRERAPDGSLKPPWNTTEPRDPTSPARLIMNAIGGLPISFKPKSTALNGRVQRMNGYATPAFDEFGSLVASGSAVDLLHSASTPEIESTRRSVRKLAGKSSGLLSSSASLSRLMGPGVLPPDVSISHPAELFSSESVDALFAAPMPEVPLPFKSRNLFEHAPTGAPRASNTATPRDIKSRPASAAPLSGRGFPTARPNVKVPLQMNIAGLPPPSEAALQVAEQLRSEFSDDLLSATSPSPMNNNNNRTLNSSRSAPALQQLSHSMPLSRATQPLIIASSKGLVKALPKSCIARKNEDPQDLNMLHAAVARDRMSKKKQQAEAERFKRQQAANESRDRLREAQGKTGSETAAVSNGRAGFVDPNRTWLSSMMAEAELIAREKLITTHLAQQHALFEAAAAPIYRERAAAAEPAEEKEMNSSELLATRLDLSPAKPGQTYSAPIPMVRQTFIPPLSPSSSGAISARGAAAAAADAISSAGEFHSSSSSVSTPVKAMRVGRTFGGADPILSSSASAPVLQPLNHHLTAQIASPSAVPVVNDWATSILQAVSPQQQQQQQQHGSNSGPAHGVVSPGSLWRDAQLAQARAEKKLKQSELALLHEPLAPLPSALPLADVAVSDLIKHVKNINPVLRIGLPIRSKYAQKLEEVKQALHLEKLRKLRAMAPPVVESKATPQPTVANQAQ